MGHFRCQLHKANQIKSELEANDFQQINTLVNGPGPAVNTAESASYKLIFVCASLFTYLFRKTQDLQRIIDQQQPQSRPARKEMFPSFF